MDTNPNDVKDFTRKPSDVVGKHFTFDYPPEFSSLPDYSAHRGHRCLVVRQCRADEADVLYDDPDGGDNNRPVDRMYVVQCDDGWIGYAWDSELSEAVSTYALRRERI